MGYRDFPIYPSVVVENNKYNNISRGDRNGI